jgi:hypothetical protein
MFMRLLKSIDAFLTEHLGGLFVAFFFKDMAARLPDGPPSGPVGGAASPGRENRSINHPFHPTMGSWGSYDPHEF